MKKILLFALLLFLFGTTYSFGQQTAADGARASALQITEALSEYIDGHSYLLFSVANTTYLVVVKKEDKYEEYHVRKDNLGFNIYKQGKIKGNKKILKKVFDTDNYHQGYIDLNSPFFSDGYRNSHFNLTYFYIKDTDENIYGELLLPFNIVPHPIDSEIYLWLIGRWGRGIEGK